MNVWIVNPYGSLPSEAWREYRSWMLAKAFDRAGHRVIWWISDFEHRTKLFRPGSGSTLKLTESISAVLVPSVAYQRNISIARITYEKRFAKSFVSMANKYPAPDLVIVAEPALFYGPAIVSLCRKSRWPIVVDILDLWPELFAVVLPSLLMKLNGIIFHPLYARRKRLLRTACAILAVSKDYAEVGIRANPNLPAHVSYLGIDLDSFMAFYANDRSDKDRWADLPKKAPGEVWVVYAGTLGEAYDFPTLIRAMKRLALDGPGLRFFIAGEGPYREEIEALSIAYPGFVNFLGLVQASDLPRLYSYCDIGLATYSEGSTVSMPVKVYDYFAGGLATITSLGREIQEILELDCVGLSYDASCEFSLANAIRRLKNEPALLAMMRQKAIRIAPRYDSVIQHDKAVAFIQDVLSPQSTSSM